MREGRRTRGKGREGKGRASCLASLARPGMAWPGYVDRFTLLAGHIEDRSKEGKRREYV